jgi:hypothetical protein
MTQRLDTGIILPFFWHFIVIEKENFPDNNFAVNFWQSIVTLNKPNTLKSSSVT